MGSFALRVTDLRTAIQCSGTEVFSPGIVGRAAGMPFESSWIRPSKNRDAQRLAPGQQLALRFISGKYQGGEFPLTEGVPIIVGRSSDLDMVLVEEMVSRRHARIELRQGVVRVEDLGSTNAGRS